MSGKEEVFNLSNVGNGVAVAMTAAEQLIKIQVPGRTAGHAALPNYDLLDC
jgi:hypothetical protein